MKIKKINFKRLLILALAIAFIAPSFIDAGAVYAEGGPGGDAGGGGDGGGVAGCLDQNGKRWIYSTCKGAGWKFYPWPGTAVYIDGIGEDYARPGVIDGCGQAVGYWRYAVVHEYTGVQKGLKAIGSGTSTWRAQHLTAGTLPDEATGIPWSMVVEEYALAYSMASEQFEARGFGPGEMSNPYSTLSWFCAYTEPPKEQVSEAGESAIHTCPLGFEYSKNFGKSAAQSSVKNMSKGESFTDHQTSSTPGEDWKWTYAKPGDSVQFKHVYCYAAAAVKKSSGYVTDSQRFNISATNKFKITAEPTEKYRFGNNLDQGIYNDEITFTLNGEQKVAALEGKVDVNEVFGFTVFSPSIQPNAGDRYDCKHRLFISNWFKVPGYQVTGFDSPQIECNSFSQNGGRSDAGTTFSQNFDWTHTHAWIKESHRDEGSCNCDQNSRKIENFTTYDYPGAELYGQANYSGRICQVAKNACRRSGCTVTPTDDCMRDGWKSPELLYLFAEEYLGPDNGLEPLGNRKKVSVVVPYNYDTSVHPELGTGANTSYIGEKVGVSFSWSIIPRSNPDVGGTYATITPATKVQFIEFAVSPDSTSGEGKVEGGISKSDPCGYYTGEFGGYMQACKPIREETKRYNEKGDYSGKSYYWTDDRTLPDVEPGTKYCVAMGIFPADSHDKPYPLTLGVGDSSPEKGSGNGQEGQVGTSWRISNAVCRTLSKKPNFQVWGAGIYTKGNIITSTSSKKPSNKSIFEQFSTWGAATHIFGSWDEYTVIAAGTVKRFASATGYGYEQVYNNENNLISNGGILPTGGANPDADFCSVLSRMTFGSKCDANTSSAGNSSIQSSTAILDRLTSRYIPSNWEINNTLPDITDSNRVDNFCNKINYITCKELPSGATYIKVQDGATLNRVLSPGLGGTREDGSSDNKTTVIIDAGNGTINISKNICYLDETCINSTKLTSNGTTINSIASLPQVLIFAKNISISDTVSQIDAWLIATGNINTCKQFEDGATSTLGCNKTLTINGPVFANTLSLNRTAGANQGTGTPNGDTKLPDEQILSDDGSITPAEIFNLRPDTYYWAYSQAQRYSQAIVTYSRELAPRY